MAFFNVCAKIQIINLQINLITKWSPLTALKGSLNSSSFELTINTCLIQMSHTDHR